MTTSLAEIDIRPINKNKEIIEMRIINKNIDISSMSAIELITFIMEEIELIKDIEGKTKKDLVISILYDISTSKDNIFIKANNDEIIKNINHMMENRIIGEIIDTMICCAKGLVKINKSVKQMKACCIPLFSK